MSTTTALQRRLTPIRRRLTLGEVTQPRRSASTFPSSRAAISNGDRGTQQTLERMGQLAIAAAHDPQFIDHARALVADLPNKAYLAEAERVFDHVKKTVRYVHDPSGLEVLQDPRWVMFVGGTGDCDEHAALITALGMALGMGAAFRTVSTTCEVEAGQRVCPWRHVYAVLGVPKGDGAEWIPADTAEGGYLGWEPQGRSITRSRTWVIAQPA